MKKRLAKSILLSLITLSIVNCSSFGRSLKSLVAGDSERQPASEPSLRKMGKIEKKNYRKVTRQSMEEQSELGEDSGSLWISRGQGAYLFAQNTNRLIGDLINIEIDGHPKKQVETKVKVIENLLEKIKERSEARRLARRRKAGKRGVASNGATPAAQAASAAKGGGSKEFPVKIVPSRIVEVLKDGSYRIQGDQPFMIDKREYKLVVTGIVRQADFDDQGISAETLLDPKFDIVTSKKRKGKYRLKRRRKRKKT